VETCSKSVHQASLPSGGATVARVGSSPAWDPTIARIHGLCLGGCQSEGSRSPVEREGTTDGGAQRGFQGGLPDRPQGSSQACIGSLDPEIPPEVAPTAGTRRMDAEVVN